MRWVPRSPTVHSPRPTSTCPSDRTAIFRASLDDAATLNQYHDLLVGDDPNVAELCVRWPHQQGGMPLRSKSNEKVAVSACGLSCRRALLKMIGRPGSGPAAVGPGAMM